MKSPIFFLASDLSPHLTKKLAQLAIKSENARGLFLNDYINQFSYCLAHKRIIVTKNRQLMKLCEQMHHPNTFIINGSAKDEEIINEIKRFIRLFKIRNLVT